MTRAERIRRFFLSPGFSVIVGAAALTVMALRSPGPEGWLATLLTAGIAALMVYSIKARALFRGPNFPFAALFPALQAVSIPSLTGTLVALVAMWALMVDFVNFHNRDNTRPLFWLYLICGLGALGDRSFALLGAALLVPAILVHYLSARGTVAALLGFITPAILAIGFGLYDPRRLPAMYLPEWLPGFAPVPLALGALALLSALLTFWPSYGYPAKMRARNMAVIGLAAALCALPSLDSADAAELLPALNLCAAYNLAHYSVLGRATWVTVLLVAAGAATLLLI